MSRYDPSKQDRPKRKVKKNDFWINIYDCPKYGNNPQIKIGTAFFTAEEADNNQDSNRLGEAYHVIHEYEVEEQ